MITKDIKDRLDPEVYEFYKPAFEAGGFGGSFSESDIPAIREDEIVRHSNNLDVYQTNSFDIEIERESGDPLPLRIYTPVHENGETDGKKDASLSARSIFSVGSPGSDLPVLLYFHGGGFIMGSIYDHDPLCGKLADTCNAVVISVEYRLAPEHPFPACIEDARDAANWAYEHAHDFGGDPEHLMAGGDSSGANISAALALMSKEKDAEGDPLVPKLSYLILFYGVYGCYGLDDSPSAAEYGGGDFVLPNDMMEACLKLYLPKDKYPEGENTRDYRLAPGRDGDLTDFPPSLIVTAEFDPLRSDSEEFAGRLRDSGCETEEIKMDGMMHGFVLYWQKFSRVKTLLEEIGDKVRRRFSD